MDNIRGIYKIENKINKKVYIGESLDVKRRWVVHKSELRNNIHQNHKLQQDWNLYGSEMFEFSIITKLDNSIANFRDKYILIIFEYKYMKKFNSIERGYNIENTIDKIKKKEKVITLGKDDVGIMKNNINAVKSKKIVDQNGIIKVNEEIVRLNIIEKEFDNLDIHVLKRILEKNKIINYQGKAVKNSKLNSIQRKYCIVSNESYESCELYISGYVKLKKYIKEEINKCENFKEDYLVRHKDGYVKEGDVAMREFLTEYELQVSYSNIFVFLRQNNILRLEVINQKKLNMVADDYLEYMYNKEQDTYTIVMIKEAGKKFLEDLFIKNKLIKKIEWSDES